MSVTDTKEKEILDTGLSLCHDSHARGFTVELLCLKTQEFGRLFFVFVSIFGQSVWTLK